ncbi:MAG: asparaginase [Bacillota bacterium]|nr:asparaginase [Bacillota bacterium]MDW7677996.1 asparaginase [Bacillota bacterium]
MSIVLAQATRNNHVENLYRGDAVVVNTDQKIMMFLGDPHKLTFWRSAAKPFQVLPFLEAGGMERFGITDKELALMTASHGGEPIHVVTAANLLAKMGLNEEALRCGSAPPMHQPSMINLLKSKKAWTPLHNCCSGKHGAMIALAAMKGYDPACYDDLSHPVQQEILSAISEVTGMDPETIGIGTDGCGVPIYYLPISRMAQAYALLATPDKHPDQKRRDGLRLIADVMTHNPWYVAGTGRLDTILMEVTEGKLLAKLGADGVYCVSVMGEGIGIALKIESGDVRVIQPVIVALLSQLGLINDNVTFQLHSLLDSSIYNHRREIIGRFETVF